MNIVCHHNVSAQLRRAVSELALPGGVEDQPDTLLYERTAPLGDAEVAKALGAGQTLALAHAPAGPLFGGQVAAIRALREPAALVAVSQRPVRPGAEQLLTSITVLPESRPAGEQRLFTEQGPHGPVEPLIQAAPDPAEIAAALAAHGPAELPGDSDLVPPTGASYAIVQVSQPWRNTLTQGSWTENEGATQVQTSQCAQTFYIYYVNGDNGGQPPYYLVLAVQQGAVTAADGGSLCDYGPNERVFVLSQNVVSLDLTQCPAGSSLLTCSPGTTTESPVTDSVDLPMTVMALADGGLQSTPFTADRTATVPNDDWAASVTGTKGGSPNEAALQYYNTTYWNGATSESFAVWWSQMYDTNDDVVGLDHQCQTSASFDVMAAWIIPENPGNAAPLDVGLLYKNLVTFVGFANPAGSGNGHHMMMTTIMTYEWYLPTWELVSLTGSGS